MKKNQKGFLLAETLIVSTFISIILTLVESPPLRSDLWRWGGGHSTSDEVCYMVQVT